MFQKNFALVQIVFPMPLKFFVIGGVKFASRIVRDVQKFLRFVLRAATRHNQRRADYEQNIFHFLIPVP